MKRRNQASGFYYPGLESPPPKKFFFRGPSPGPDKSDAKEEASQSIASSPARNTDLESNEGTDLASEISEESSFHQEKVEIKASRVNSSSPFTTIDYGQLLSEPRWNMEKRLLQKYFELEDVESILQDPHTNIISVNSQSEVASGTVLVVTVRPDSMPYIEYLNTRSIHQGKGLGTALVVYGLNKFAPEATYANMCVSVSCYDEDGNKFPDETAKKYWTARGAFPCTYLDIYKECNIDPTVRKIESQDSEPYKLPLDKLTQSLPFKLPNGLHPHEKEEALARKILEATQRGAPMSKPILKSSVPRGSPLAQRGVKMELKYGKAPALNPFEY